MPRLRKYASTIVPEIGCAMSCGFGRSHGGRWLPPVAIRRRFRSWQAEEGSRLVEHVAQTLQPLVQGDEVEEIAMLAGGGVGPFAGGAFPAVRPREANEQATAGSVGHVADDPVATSASTVGEVAAAHRLGITRETACQITGLRSHVAHAAALSASVTFRMVVAMSIFSATGGRDLFLNLQPVTDRPRLPLTLPASPPSQDRRC
jgi:hypothetical protein